MSYVRVLCVLLLASQVEMLPVNPVELLTRESPVDLVDLASAIQRDSAVDVNEVLFTPKKAALVHPGELFSQESSVGLVNLASENQKDLAVNGNGVLSRLKRAALANSGYSKCSYGMTELWHDGPCVTCEKYMDLRDVDECPASR